MGKLYLKGTGPFYALRNETAGGTAIWVADSKIN